MRAQRIFLTGATGAMGCAIIAHLVNDGHAVTGTVRTDAGASLVSALGGTPVRVDLFEPFALVTAMAGSDAVAHFATRIPAGFAATRVGAWADNDRLRREATTDLIAAATTASVPRFIFESLALAYPDRGRPGSTNRRPPIRCRQSCTAPWMRKRYSATFRRAVVSPSRSDSGDCMVLVERRRPSAPRPVSTTSWTTHP